MSENTKIEWCDHTFNPWVGCSKISPACDNCYAEGWAKRSGSVKWGGERRRTTDANWNKVFKWNREAHGKESRPRVFCASLADVFDNQVPTEWRLDLFSVIDRTPNLDWLLLTKRIGNADAMIRDAIDGLVGARPWPWPNVWLGATICNQDEADRDIPKLLATPAAVRFLSIEPMLGPIDLTADGLVCTPCRWCIDHSADPDTGAVENCRRCDWTGKSDEWGIDWVIAGGESGPKARPMHPSWVRGLRDQCAAAGVPFLFKQHGEWLATDFCNDDMAMIPSKRTVYVRLDGSFHDGADGVDFFGDDEETAWVGKEKAGRLLDGRLHDEYPAAPVAALMLRGGE